jgi:hypothetical protein
MTGVPQRLGNAAPQEGFVLNYENNQSSETVCD